MDIQGLVEGLNKAGEMERGRYHLTLLDAIDKLGDCDQSKPVIIDHDGYSPCDVSSYRGYYSDLAIETRDDPALTVAGVRAMLLDALDETFEGYKGGDFTMHAKTPLWVAEWGRCGRAVMGLKEEADAVVIITKEID